MSMTPSKMDYLKSITVLNFLLEDLGLYLNTHPTDCEAVCKYNALVEESNKLKENYEKCCRMISEHSSASSCPWQWICEPWPWEYEANFRLCEREE